MANAKISELPEIPSTASDDVLPIVDTSTGITSKVQLGDLLTSGTVTTVSVTTANGVSGSVADPTTTPAITLTLGAITPSSVVATGSIRSNTSLILEETGAGTDTITLQAPSSIGASFTLTLPDTDGDSGQFLQTNGSGVLTWAAGGGSPAGSNMEIQFNNSSAFGADSKFRWSTADAALYLGTAATPSSTITIATPDATGSNIGSDGLTIMTGAPTGSGSSGQILIRTQNAVALTDGDGGAIILDAGDGGSTDGSGGDVQLAAGNGFGAGAAGNVLIGAGSGTGADAGGVTLSGGASTSGVGGSVTLNGGNSGASSFAGGVILNGGNGGTAGGYGGTIALTAGLGDGSGGGGQVNLVAGNGGEEGDGGVVEITAGDGGATSGGGGNVNIHAGVAYADIGGSVELFAGSSDNTGTGGQVEIEAGNGGEGGRIELLAGTSNAESTTGGVVQIQSGNGAGATSNGGNINLFLGTGTTNRGRLNITGLPTSSAGLASGDIWLNSNVLTIVP